MSLAQIVLDRFRKNEGREDTYKILRKMDNASWNSFMADISTELGKETKRITPTATLNKVLSRVVGR